MMVVPIFQLPEITSPLRCMTTRRNKHAEKPTEYTWADREASKYETVSQRCPPLYRKLADIPINAAVAEIRTHDRGVLGAPLTTNTR